MAVSLRAPDRALAQAREDGDRNIIELITNLVTSLSDKTRDGVLGFLETVELFDAEAEIDRLVGSPWELHDSTSYKLGLLPVHIGFPIYQQLARQMTRLDDVRSRRIYNVTPGSVEVIALRIDSDALERQRGDVLGSLLRHFSVREVVDMGVFALSHQPLFPDSEDGWRSYKRDLAEKKLVLVTSVLAAGAAFEAGALARSGTLVASPAKDYRLGWYGGFRRLGFAFQPQLRAGLTAQVPGFEVAAGVSERVRPDADHSRRALEIAVREGWLNRLARPGGWDVFFEGALRGVFSAEPRYAGETTTGRAGLFFKRVGPLRLRNFVFRSSAEMESDFTKELRFAAGFGLEHTRSGVATVLQSSRTAITRDGARTRETRGGLFFAGTMEPPTRFLVEAMQDGARRVRESWDAIEELERRRKAADERLRVVAFAQLSAEQRQAALEQLGRDTAAVEAQVAELAPRLADYLESRRLAYSVLRWQRTRGDLHGPLDGDILASALQMVYARLRAVADFLENACGAIEPIRRRFFTVRDMMASPLHGTNMLAAYRSELEDLDRKWRQEAERVDGGMRVYAHYRDHIQRITAAASRLPPPPSPDPLRPHTARRLTALAALPLVAR